MLKVTHLNTEDLMNPIGIDELFPRYSWRLESDKKDVKQASYHIVVKGSDKVVWDSGEVMNDQSLYIVYSGKELKPFTTYTWTVRVTDNLGETACSEAASFETGRMGMPWAARWIATPGKMDDDSVTPTHIYRKVFAVHKPVVRARLYTSALGVYSINLGGRLVSDRFFAPGYTDYVRHVQYQAYDVTELISSGDNIVMCEVAGGWYTGRLGMVLKGNRYGKKRALILELHMDYADGTKGIVCSDESFEYTCDGPRRFAGFFDGEVYDANREDSRSWKYEKALLYKGKTPQIVPDIGLPVRRHSEIVPVATHTVGGSVIYNFGRNIAGIIKLCIDAPQGKTVTISHAEILGKDGDLYTGNLRTAKAQLIYISKGGAQEYEPRFTYMGFQYVKVEGVDISQIKSICAYELYSDLTVTVSFSCSHELLNKLQENIQTSQKANFVDIPTDCPQRDERVGWTGDIAMFSPTAAFNMNVGRFMRKWLRDLRSEQQRFISGNIPFVVPSGNVFWMRLVTSPIWSDASVIVPWDTYMATGDLRLLTESYESMKRWLSTMKRISTFGKLPFMKNYYVYYFFSWGDWVAPGIPIKEQWRRGRWISTAYFANSAKMVAKIAHLLGNACDAEKYERLSEKIGLSFCRTFLDEGGHIKNGFQSIYADAIRFGILPEKAHQAAVEDLEKDVDKHNDHLMTGFPGTPHLLFALADCGREDTAFRLLMQESCPSWLYPVKCGATSIWERWDALQEDGSVNEEQVGSSNMVSFNHYAYGAVGEFLYSRVAGLEPVESGYKHFKVAPIAGGGLTCAKACYQSPYGMILVEWAMREDQTFSLFVTVPPNTSATVCLPDKQQFEVGSGEHRYTCRYGN